MDKMQLHKILEDGRRLSEEQANAIEQELDVNSDQANLRIKLLSHLMLPHFENKEVARRRAKHVLWFIDNMPAHPILSEPEGQIQDNDESYFAAKQLLQTKLDKDPTNVLLIWNVALSVLIEDKKLAEDLLRRGESLKPDDPGWSLMLSVIYDILADECSEEERKKWLTMGKKEKNRRRQLNKNRQTSVNPNAWYL